MKTTSRCRTRSFRSQGPSIKVNSGAADCRKMALAAVVSLLARTNRIIVVAYTAPTATTRRFQRRLAAGTRTSNVSAATPERNDATCQPVRDVALMAAPPVENSVAVSNSCSREMTRGSDMGSPPAGIAGAGVF